MTNFEPIKTNKSFKKPEKLRPRPRPKCSYQGKNSYKTYGQAEKRRLRILFLGHVEYIRIYKCGVCHWFHFTSQKPRK